LLWLPFATSLLQSKSKVASTQSKQGNNEWGVEAMLFHIAVMVWHKLLVSLAMPLASVVAAGCCEPLASVVAAGCEHILRVGASSKSYECKQRGDLCTVPLLQQN
jgi:hypothetical protein